jgi:hypothetical protein
MWKSDLKMEQNQLNPVNTLNYIAGLQSQTGAIITNLMIIPLTVTATTI